MWNLLVSGKPKAWEHSTCRMLTRRFGEHSIDGWGPLSLDDTSRLQQIETLPTLLVYESGVESPSAHIVRYGVISRLRCEKSELVFDFSPAEDRGYLPREILWSFAEELGIHRFQWHRTHWSVKAGSLPETLLRQAPPKPPSENVPLIYPAYRKAVQAGVKEQAAACESGLAQLPPSEEKAFAYLRSSLEGKPCLTALPLLGYRRQGDETRQLIESINGGAEVILDPLPKCGLGCLPFLLADFYGRLGGPTECGRIADATEDCLAILTDLESQFRTTGGGLPSIAYVLWRAGQSPVLVRQLRSRLRLVIDRLMEERPSSRIWSNSDQTSDLQATSMLTVGMQRVGDGKHRHQLRLIVKSLCHFQRPDGEFAADEAGSKGDVLTTVLILESVFRAGLAEELTHVINKAEKWLWRQQTPAGAWQSTDWEEASITTTTLAYLEGRPTILPQVDGFFLMARDFYTHASDLIYQDGKNNRRLATIALVHAVEMFLYGLFERNAELGVSIYRDKGDETLGPREALRSLQDALRSAEIITKKATLSYRDQLSRLVRERDSVIHHAGQVGREETENGRVAVERFIGKYGIDLCGIDLLQ